jgi:type II secretory pathway pseudopilin PulG
MKYNPLRPSAKAAFSLLEVMMACGILAITAAAAIGTLVRMNHYAALSRLQTGASTVAQERIDRILEDGPFAPKDTAVPVPQVLQVGTQTVGTEADPTVPIYTDPETNQVSVYGWMTSTVTKSNIDYGPWHMEVRRADVKVEYKFRGKSYSVRMTTMRCPDA